MLNKICVYGISKNEEKFVDRFMDSIGDVDVFILDTGSTDNTVEKLKSRGANVTVKKIDPWRFDVARNESLKLIPEDYNICICLDLDEVISPNYIEIINKLWNVNTTRFRYNYNWKLDNDNKPIVNFYIEKIHLRNGYKWIHPVHEVLCYDGKEEFVTTDEITVNHYPDETKSRSCYLPLLELSVKEDPLDDRNMHYLGREYMYYGMWNKSIDTLIKHLNLKKSTWKDERCASMRFISRCYKNLKRFDEAKMWLDKALLEAPYLREPYIEKALLELDLKNYNEVINNCLEALKIHNKPKTYINEAFNNYQTIYDLLSIAYYNINNLEEAIKYVDLALIFDESNKRINDNKNLFIRKFKEKFIN